jgi:hypothetical protein
MSPPPGADDPDRLSDLLGGPAVTAEPSPTTTARAEMESTPRQGRILVWCTGILAAMANALVLLGWFISATVAECEGDISFPVVFLGSLLGAVTVVAALIGAAYTRRWSAVVVAGAASIPVVLFVVQGLDSMNGYWLYNYCSS